MDNRAQPGPGRAVPAKTIVLGHGGRVVTDHGGQLRTVYALDAFEEYSLQILRSEVTPQ